jgi:hypothetical protein
MGTTRSKVAPIVTEAKISFDEANAASDPARPLGSHFSCFTYVVVTLTSVATRTCFSTALSGCPS